jgi:hypothetical protein
MNSYIGCVGVYLGEPLHSNTTTYAVCDTGSTNKLIKCSLFTEISVDIVEDSLVHIVAIVRAFTHADSLTHTLG